MGKQGRVSQIIRQSSPEKSPGLFDAEQVKRFKDASQIALTVLGQVGAASLAVIAPWVLIGMDAFVLRKSPSKKISVADRRNKLTKTFYYLRRKGYIKMKVTGDDIRIFLTDFGREKLKRIDFDNLQVRKPGSWDGKWWQVAADIPTQDYKRAADMLREKLKEMKFFPLQRTLWFYPYDPRKEIEFIIQHYGIEKFVTVMEINRLDRDDEEKMLSYFKSEKTF